MTIHPVIARIGGFPKFGVPLSGSLFDDEGCNFGSEFGVRLFKETTISQKHVQDREPVDSTSVFWSLSPKPQTLNPKLPKELKSKLLVSPLVTPIRHPYISP